MEWALAKQRGVATDSQHNRGRGGRRGEGERRRQIENGDYGTSPNRTETSA